MPHATWILFACVAAIVLVLPGRSKRLVLSYALAHGRKSVFATATGVTLGAVTAVAATLALSWGLITLSPSAFSIYQWVGLTWMMLFGLGLLRAPVGTEPVADNDNLPEEKPLRVIAHCFESEIPGSAQQPARRRTSAAILDGLRPVPASGNGTGRDLRRPRRPFLPALCLVCCGHAENHQKTCGSPHGERLGRHGFDRGKSRDGRLPKDRRLSDFSPSGAPAGRKLAAMLGIH